MSVSIVQSLSSVATASNVSSQTLTLPSGVAAGNTLILLSAYLDSSNHSSIPATPTDTASDGYALAVQATSPNHDSSSIFFATAAGGSTAATLPKNSAATSGQCQFTSQFIEVFGVTTPYASNNASGASSGPLTVTSSASVAAGDLIVAMCEVNAAITGLSTPAGWTSLGNANSAFPSAAFAYLIPVASGVVTANFGSISVPNDWSAVIVAFKASSGVFVPWSINATTGVLSGTAVASGPQSIPVYVRDSIGSLANKTFSLTVQSASTLNYVGVNAGQTGYGSQETPWWLNEFKNASGNNGPWDTITANGTDTNEEGFLNVDPDGYPKSLTRTDHITPTFTRVRTYVTFNIYATNTLPPGASSTNPFGAFTLMFQGAGTIVCGNCSGLATSSAGISISTDGVTGQPQIVSTQSAGTVATVTLTIASSNGGGPYFEISATDPSSTGNYIKALELVDSTYVNQYLAGKLLHPVWKSVITGNGQGGFSRIRFMGALNTYQQETHLQFSGGLAQNATSGTFTRVNQGTSVSGTSWPFASGTYKAMFATGQIVNLTATYQSSSVTWDTPLSAAIAGQSAPQTSTPPFSMCTVSYAQWSKRSLMSNFTWDQGPGVPFEALLQIGNEVGIDIWLSIGMGNIVIDSTYAQNLANLAFNGTGANLTGTRLASFSGFTGGKLWWENGNELGWNFGAGYVLASTFVAMYATSTGIMAANGNNFPYGVLEQAATFAASTSDLVASTYGGSYGTRAGVVFMGQRAPSEWGQFGYLANAMNSPNAATRAYNHHIVAIGWAPYFGMGVDNTNPITSADVASILGCTDPNTEFFSLAYNNVGSVTGRTYTSSCFGSGRGWLNSAIIDSQTIYNGYAGQSFSTGWANLPITTYEGGHSMNNQSLSQSDPNFANWGLFLTNIQRDSRWQYAYYDPNKVLPGSTGGYLPGCAAIGPTNGKMTVNKLGLVQAPAFTRNSGTNSPWGGYGLLELIMQQQSFNLANNPGLQGVILYAQAG